MQQPIVYKPANISMNMENIAVGYTLYPFEDILYSEVRNNLHQVETDRLAFHDLLIDPLLNIWMSGFLSAAFLALILDALFSLKWLVALFPIFLVCSILLGAAKRTFADTNITYTLVIVSRHDATAIYTSRSLYYAQIISRTINGIVRQRMILNDQIPPSSSEHKLHEHSRHNRRASRHARRTRSN